MTDPTIQPGTPIADLTEIDAGELLAYEPRPADTNPALVYIARLAAGSKRRVRQCLDRIAGLLTEGLVDAVSMRWECLRYQHTQAIRAALMGHYAPANVNLHLACLRGVLREAWRLGLLDAESYHRAVDLKCVRGARLQPGRLVTKAELERLFRACRVQAVRVTGIRNAALLAVAYGSGLRRAEISALQVADIDLHDRELKVNHGKGDKQRMGYLPKRAARALQAWLDARGPQAGPLFNPTGLDGIRRDQHLGTPSIAAAFRRMAASAGIAPFSPHDLRRSFISGLLDKGVDLSTVQRLAGHANVQTTAQYDRRPAAVQKQAVEKLDVPFDD